MATALLAEPAHDSQRLVRPKRQADRAVLIPASAHTWEGFRAWAKSDEFPTHGHIAYLGGEISIDMSPERLGKHNAAKSELTHVLYQLIRANDLGRFLSDRMLLSNEAADISNEPDAFFVSWASLAAGRVRLVPTADGDDIGEIVGTPDMVLEIVSPSSERKDYSVLMDRYFRAGIREYWLMDGNEEELVFHIYHASTTGYSPIPLENGWLASAVFGRRFRMERSRARDDQWQYTLHVASLDPAV